MTNALKSTAELTSPELADLFTRAFTGYIGGSFRFDAPSLLTFVNRENVDLSLSRVLMQHDVPGGVCFLARQGWTTRVAAMGIVPESQEKRAGTWFMEHIIEEAVARGEKTMVLEAFEQNTRAVRLYQRSGFKIIRRLMGYTCETLSGLADPALTQIDIYEIGRLIMVHGAADLPWQVSGTSIARQGLPNRGYRLGPAYAVISDPAQPAIALRALIVEPAARRMGHGKRLLHALAAEFPGKKWTVSPICPEEFGVAFFEEIGFTRNPLNQVQMELTLAEAG